MTVLKSDLVLAYIESQPISAAAILEQQPLEGVAEFIEHIPYKQAAIVLQTMLPQYTARLCKLLKPTVSAALLSVMEISFVAAILRYTDLAVREQVLSCLPEKTRLNCTLLLNYSETTVGAWMMANIPCIPHDCDVKAAIAIISKLEELLPLDSIYVVDRERTVKGCLSATQLISASANKRIETIMHADFFTVSGRASLISVARDKMWQQCESVAVINRKQQLVGVLRHLDLRNGLAEISSTIRDPKADDPISGIWDVYGNSLLALFDTITDASALRVNK